MTRRQSLARDAARLIELLLARIRLDSPPEDLHDLLSEIAHTAGLRSSLDEAQELVDELIERVRRELDVQMNEAIERGVTWRIEVFGSSHEWIRGAAYLDGSLPGEVSVVRSRRAHIDAAISWLNSLEDPYVFEGLCTTILKSFGCEYPRTSWKSNDGGIDFYGRLSLHGRLDSQMPLGGFDRGAGVWLIGQAKHLRGNSVGVAVIREMVGSVELARTGGALRDWPDLDFRPFDPVIMLVFTTGRFTSESMRLLNKSGMLSMDGAQLATFLCDAGLGFTAESSSFDPDLLLNQINERSNPVGPS